MRFSFKAIAGFFLVAQLITQLVAQQPSGKDLYVQYCSACHGLDGIGPKGNPNPPLADSEWLLGKPDRAIAAVLKGLTGPIEVKGKVYNLAMPPQGELLNDESLAKILSYVRKSWENKQSAVTAKQVAAVRQKLEKRSKPWTSGELRDQYPIIFPRKHIKLDNVISTIYHGKWEGMPDFKDLTPVAAEEELDGVISIRRAGRTKEVAIVWTGDLYCDFEYDYRASMKASDGARLYIDDKLILKIEGVGPPSDERTKLDAIRLTRGKHSFRLEYFNNSSSTPTLVWKMRGAGKYPFFTDSQVELNPAPEPVIYKAPKNSAIIYRNFISGSTTRTVGVGYDGGVNQAFSIDHLGPASIWTGTFINAGKHFYERGQGYVPPAGDNVVALVRQPAYTLTGNITAKDWDPSKQKAPVTNFLGYALDSQKFPTFRYTVQGLKVTDFMKPGKVSKGRTHSFTRRITYDNSSSKTINLSLLLTQGKKLALKSPQVLQHDSGLTIELSSSKIHNYKNQRAFAHLSLPPGKSELTIRYTWSQPAQ